jgi:hypothetical protein
MDAPSRLRSARNALRVLPRAAGLTVLLALSFASAASASTAWTGSGTGTTTVVNDGTSGAPAQFTYSVNPGNSGSWSFSSTATTTGSIDLHYTYTGYHAFFQVRVGLSAFVTSSGSTITTPLVNAGPVNCCTAPSGGFSYTGTITLAVHAGDTFGFAMSGSNGDSDRRLLGTLTVEDLTPPQTNRSGYCSAPGNTNGLTGASIPAGTFLDLATGQPSEDAHYAGATPAIFVAGQGITCDPPPVGFVLSGLVGIYPFYRAG